MMPKGTKRLKAMLFVPPYLRITLLRLFPPPFIMSYDSDLGYPDVKLFTIVDSLVSVIRESSVACRFIIVIMETYDISLCVMIDILFISLIRLSYETFGLHSFVYLKFCL